MVPTEPHQGAPGPEPSAQAQQANGWTDRRPQEAQNGDDADDGSKHAAFEGDGAEGKGAAVELSSLLEKGAGSRPGSGRAGNGALSDLGRDASPPPGVGARHVQALLMFLCTSVSYSLRVNISVAIVAMTSDKAGGNPDFPIFDWSKQTQSTLLSAFFWGYVVMQLPASQLAQRLGARRFLSGAMLGTGILTVVLPATAIYGPWQLVAAARVCTGLCQGFVFPSCYVLLGKWAPPQERARFTGFVMGAQMLGPVVMLPLTGWLAASAGGWPSVFYLSGAMGMAVGTLVFFFASDSPSQHGRISAAERDYILRATGVGKAAQKTPRTPWRALLRSVPLWAAVASHVGHAWGYVTIIMEVPSYISHVHHFNVKENGLLSALPYITTWIMSFVFSWASDFINHRQIIKLTTLRKISNSIGMWGPGLAMLGVGCIQGSPALAVALLTAALGLMAGTFVGYQVNYVDLAPQFSGTSFSVGNLVGNVGAAMAPLTVGLIVTDQESAEQWRLVFLLACGMFFMGNLIFICFGSANVQPWNGSRKASLYLSKDSVVSQDIERLRAAAAASSR